MTEIGIGLAIFGLIWSVVIGLMAHHVGIFGYVVILSFMLISCAMVVPIVLFVYACSDKGFRAALSDARSQFGRWTIKSSDEAREAHGSRNIHTLLHMDGKYVTVHDGYAHFIQETGPWKRPAPELGYDFICNGIKGRFRIEGEFAVPEKLFDFGMSIMNEKGINAGLTAMLQVFMQTNSQTARNEGTRLTREIMLAKLKGPIFSG